MDPSISIEHRFEPYGGNTYTLVEPVQDIDGFSGGDILSIRYPDSDNDRQTIEQILGDAYRKDPVIGQDGSQSGVIYTVRNPDEEYDQRLFETSEVPASSVYGGITPANEQIKGCHEDR